MTPYERVFNRLKGKEVDKIPNLNIIMTFAAKYINIPYKKYVKDYRYLVEGNIKCCSDFGIDMVSTISDPCREAYDFGANITFFENEAPVCKDYLIKKYKDIKKLKVKDPLKEERMLDRVKAIRLFKRKVRGFYPILGWIEGPFAEAADLRGMNNIMIDLLDKPDFVYEILDICSKQAIAFGLEQVKAGADFIGLGESAASLVGPDIYNRFILPYEKIVINAIHDMGAKVKLHICGNITNILDLVVLTGADIIDIEWMMDFKKAVNTFKGKASACGNFDPVGVLLNGSEEEVNNAVKRCVKLGDNKTFIAASCEVPKNTPIKNMLKVDETLKKFS